MGCPIEKIPEIMSNEEIIFWRAKWEVDPFGPRADWWRYGNQRSDHHNAHFRDPKKKRIPYKPDEFIPTFKAR